MNARNQSNRILTLAVLTMATFVVSSSPAKAVTIFSEAWETTGSQATVDGQTFNNYSEWDFSEENATNSNARVDSVGVLTLAKGSASNTLGGVVTPTSIGTASPFDVSAFPLTLTVDAGRGFNNGATSTNSNAGAFIGDIAFVFHPGSAGGFHRIEKMNANLSNNTVLMPNTNMGFSPGIDGATANTGFSRIVIDLAEKDADEYTFTYSITDLVDGNIYNNSIDVLKADVGPLDRAGVRFAGGADGADGIFQNFALTQPVAAPEPSTIALAALGLLSLGMTRRRRQR